MSPPKKKKKPLPDMRVKELADGRKIYPKVNGKVLHPEIFELAGAFENVLRLLAGFDPEQFPGEAPQDQIKALIHGARHYCDSLGLAYEDIDKEAHIEYSQVRWLAHEKHEGVKA